MRRRRPNIREAVIRTALFSVGVAMFFLAILSIDPLDKPVEVSPEVTSPVIETPVPVIDSSDEALIQAVIDGDSETGVLMENEVCTYNELLQLSSIMEAESGPHWPDWALMAIGEVVMNRVKSQEFPDTIWGVLSQKDPVQYEPVYQDAWKDIRPDERTVRLAFDLLNGERVLDNPQIVFQALFPQGSETIVTYTDTDLDTTTYFCTTYYPEFYEGGK